MQGSNGKNNMPERLYLWGAGGVGKRALKHLAPLGILDGIIDADSSKHGQKLCGLPILDYDAAKPKLKDSGVIIAHFSPKETEEILKKDGVAHWRLSEFLTAWYREAGRENAVGFLDFPITTRCTLNCEKCMQYMPYRQKQDIPIDTLKHEIDALFRVIDFVGEISAIGGEPLLHKNLSQLVDYLGKNYSKQIGSLVITTNGTALPDAEILEACRKADVFISISDYSGAISGMEERLKEFEKAVTRTGVNTERKRWTWNDPGRFDRQDIECVVAAGRSNGCALEHMQLYQGKLWRCTLMAAGYAAGLCGAEGGRDYIDLVCDNSDAKIQSFLTVGATSRTSQCDKCLYPSKVAVASAAQMPQSGER